MQTRPSNPSAGAYMLDEISAQLAAVMLGCEAAEVERMIENGELVGRISVRGRAWVNAVDLARYLRSQGLK